MTVTAKVKLQSVAEIGEGDARQAGLQFVPDYADGRNAAWAMATPALNLAMTVRGDVADAHFREGQAFTLVFEPDGEVEALVIDSADKAAVDQAAADRQAADEQTADDAAAKKMK
jgi:hypothetical protein